MDYRALGQQATMNSGQMQSLYSQASTWANENQGVVAIALFCLALFLSWSSGLFKLLSSLAIRFYEQCRKQRTGIDFVIRLGSSCGVYWELTTRPLMPGMLKRFKPKWTQAFQISVQHFVEDVDPSFDLTMSSKLTHSTVITGLQVEIISVAHEINFYGGPQAAKISQQAFYVVEMPDVKKMVSARNNGVFPRLLEPVKLGTLVDLQVPDPYMLEPGQAFRCELLLRHYVARMPNYAVLRFWLCTASGRYSSGNILVFTL